MKILVTGANGMVARALIDYCARVGDTVSPYARQQLDISDRNRVFDVLEREKPDAVINCAAYTNVDGAESDENKCSPALLIGYLLVIRVQMHSIDKKH